MLGDYTDGLFKKVKDSTLLLPTYFKFILVYRRGHI